MNLIWKRILKTAPAWIAPLAMAIVALGAALGATFDGNDETVPDWNTIGPMLMAAWGLWLARNTATKAADVKASNGKSVEDLLNGKGD